MARAFLSIAAAVALLVALTCPVGAAVPSLKQPKWVELSPQQREILAPLSLEWDKLETFRRKKWLGIARRYPSLSPPEQQRMQRRMQAWVKLSPEERTQVREQFKNLKQAPPELRQAIKQKWQEYEELPEAEKERLKQSTKRKPQPKTAAGKPTPPAALPAPPPAPPPITVAPAAPAQQ